MFIVVILYSFICYYLSNVIDESNMNGVDDGCAASLNNQVKEPINLKNHFIKDNLPGADLWTNGLICAFELVQGPEKKCHSKSGSKIQSSEVSSDMNRSVFGHDIH